MYTLGYPFRPWTGPRRSPTGRRSSHYLRETAREHGIDRHIRFGHRVVARRLVQRATRAGRWRSKRRAGEGDAAPELQLPLHVQRLLRLRRGLHAGRSPGVETLRGPIVHPQHWPDDIDYAGKRVVVIGSGATAVTLVPALAKRAAHVTMLQRSPTYIIVAAVRGRRWPNRLRRWLPARLPMPDRAGRTCCCSACTSTALPAPGAGAELLLGGVRHCDWARTTTLDRHFTPALQPVGPAPVPGAGRRPVPRHPRAAGRRSSPSEIETLHADRRAPASRRRARRRPDRHRHRPDAAGLRRRLDSPSTAGRSTGRDAGLQGHDVQRRAEPASRRSATRTRRGP